MGLSNILALLELPGVEAAIALGLLGLSWKAYIEPRIKSTAESAGKLSAEKELEAQRGATARLVETHKAELASQADAVKAHFQRQLTDYAIYVERRHDAVRSIYTTVVMSKGLAYGIGDAHSGESDHLRRLALRARDAVYALAGAYQLNVLYLPDAVHDQFVAVQSAFSDVLTMRENANRGLDVQPALDRMENSINLLASICRAELQSSAA